MKGVSKRVIEINATENEYFDRAVLYLRTGENAQEGKLMEEASSYLRGLESAPAVTAVKTRIRTQWMLSLAKLLSAAATGAALAVFFLKF